MLVLLKDNGVKMNFSSGHLMTGKLEFCLDKWSSQLEMVFSSTVIFNPEQRNLTCKSYLQTFQR